MRVAGAIVVVLTLLAGCGSPGTAPPSDSPDSMPAWFTYGVGDLEATFHVESRWTWTGQARPEIGLVATTTATGGPGSHPPSVVAADACGRLAWAWIETFEQGASRNEDDTLNPYVFAYPGGGGRGLETLLALRRDSLPTEPGWTRILPGPSELWARQRGEGRNSWDINWTMQGDSPDGTGQTIQWPQGERMPTKFGGYELRHVSKEEVVLPPCQPSVPDLAWSWGAWGPEEVPPLGSWLPDAIAWARQFSPALVLHERDHPDTYFWTGQWTGQADGSMEFAGAEIWYLYFTSPGSDQRVSVMCFATRQGEQATFAACDDGQVLSATLDPLPWQAAGGVFEGNVTSLQSFSSFAGVYDEMPQFHLRADEAGADAWFAFAPNGDVYDYHSVGWDLDAGHWSGMDGWRPEDLLDPPGGWPSR